ncbi:ribonuclease H-like domain-containing protein [Tanacetum coccineum]
MDPQMGRWPCFSMPWVKRFLKKHEGILNFNGKETVGFDKTKVKCYNCHRRCHFARECRAPRNRWNRNGDAPRRIVPMKTPANVLVVQDGIGGYDWSIQAEEGLTNFVIMAYRSQGSSSSSSSDSKQMGFRIIRSLEYLFMKRYEAVYEGKSGQVPVNAAKQSSPRAATSISTARPANTVAPKSKVNDCSSLNLFVS